MTQVQRKEVERQLRFWAEAAFYQSQLLVAARRDVADGRLGWLFRVQRDKDAMHCEAKIQLLGFKTMHRLKAMPPETETDEKRAAVGLPPYEEQF